MFSETRLLQIYQKCEMCQKLCRDQSKCCSNAKLYQAVKDKNFKQIENIAKHKDWLSHYGLNYACQLHDEFMMLYFVKYGITKMFHFEYLCELHDLKTLDKIFDFLKLHKVEIDYEEGLLAVCGIGSLKKAKYMMSHGAENYQLAFNMACKDSNLKLIKFLRKKGIAIYEHGLSNAITHNQFQVVKYLLNTIPYINYHMVADSFGDYLSINSDCNRMVKLLIKKLGIRQEINYIRIAFTEKRYDVIAFILKHNLLKLDTEPYGNKHELFIYLIEHHYKKIDNFLIHNIRLYFPKQKFSGDTDLTYNELIRYCLLKIRIKRQGMMIKDMMRELVSYIQY